jgi:succinate dehydrogenase / fumarate reductase flavoprotein subunit
MARYDPERMELSTRDRIAAAAYTEIKAGRGTPGGGVLLDLSHLPRDTIMRRLPRVYETLLELQRVDVTTTPIEVTPTAHYSMGGVWVRPEDGGTGVDGLYAAGEAASGLHGANRLGGNSLIELIVYGRIVGEAAAGYATRRRGRARSRTALAEARAEIDELVAADGRESVRALHRAIRDTMTEYAGVVRSEEGLVAGLSALDAIEARIAELGVHPEVASYHDVAHAFDVKASAVAARATLEAARARRETRGCHIRSDHPDADPALRVSFVWSGPGCLDPEPVPPIPAELARLMTAVSTDGKLLE